jgi:hypothetical protein
MDRIELEEKDLDLKDAYYRGVLDGISLVESELVEELEKSKDSTLNDAMIVSAIDSVRNNAECERFSEVLQIRFCIHREDKTKAEAKPEQKASP